MLFALATLICCWWMGDVSIRTKIVFTVLYLASFGLLFVPAAFIVTQCLFVAIFGVAAFGMDFLNRRMR
jgi:hypothetical protein